MTNKTDIPNDVIRDAVRFARPAGIKRFRVTVATTKRTYRGRGWQTGITIWVNESVKYPRILRTYQLAQLRGRRYYLGSFVECLIYLLAHELMHTKQGQRGNCRGRVWGARGRFSEIETESYAIRKLREWRRLN
jgi:hypothetical protein